MKRFVTAAAIAASMLFAAAPAAAQITSDFTFTGGFQFGYGTVNGHLTFANAGNGVAATGIYIDSSTDYFGAPNINTFGGANLLPMLGFVRTNTFDVTAGGQVTYGSFDGSEYLVAPTYANIYFQLNSFGGFNTYSIINADYSSKSTGNQGGFAGATYTPAATSPVPEPASWAMMIVGAGLVGAAFRRRRVSATVAIA